MPTPQSVLEPLSPKSLVKVSRLRVGPIEARGVPAILLGVAAIIVATGISAALRRGATVLPETLREARDFWRVVRAPLAELAP
jgi:hypothetical protein